VFVKNPKVVAGVAILVVVLVAGSFWMMRRGGGSSTIDLIDQLSTAEKRIGADAVTDGGQPLEVKDVTIGGQSHKAILAPPHSRISYNIQVPRRATLTLWFGLREDAVAKGSDGAQFRIGVSDGRTYEEYLREFVDPKTNEKDRRWFDASVDLSAYEGQQVWIVLNTDPEPPPARPRVPRTAVADYAVWGEPKITSK
jgi:hypothetical protein